MTTLTAIICHQDSASIICTLSCKNNKGAREWSEGPLGKSVVYETNLELTAQSIITYNVFEPLLRTSFYQGSDDSSQSFTNVSDARPSTSDYVTPLIPILLCAPQRRQEPL